MLFDECFGDRLQCTFLVIAYYQAQKKQKQNGLKLFLQRIESNPSVTLEGDDFEFVLVEINKAFENAMQSCYIDFESITEPLLTREQILHLLQIYKNKLPNHYNLMKQLLGFHQKVNKQRNIHLKESQYYDRIIFYQFLQQSRVRNRCNLTFWAMVSAADAYANGGTEKSINGLVHSAFSTTISTFLKKTKMWRDQMPEAMARLFHSKLKVVCCLDNNQKGFQLKYQRNGSSNTFVKVTATCIKQFVPIEDFIHQIKLNPEITYIEQAVPSPYGMPRFESLLDTNTSTISDENVMKVIDCVINSATQELYELCVSADPDDTHNDAPADTHNDAPADTPAENRMKDTIP